MINKILTTSLVVMMSSAVFAAGSVERIERPNEKVRIGETAKPSAMSNINRATKLEAVGSKTADKLRSDETCGEVCQRRAEIIETGSRQEVALSPEVAAKFEIMVVETAKNRVALGAAKASETGVKAANFTEKDKEEVCGKIGAK